MCWLCALLVSLCESTSNQIDQKTPTVTTSAHRNGGKERKKARKGELSHGTIRIETRERHTFGILIGMYVTGNNLCVGVLCVGVGVESSGRFFFHNYHSPSSRHSVTHTFILLHRNFTVHIYPPPPLPSLRDVHFLKGYVLLSDRKEASPTI